MKICPSCKTRYSDDTLRFCLQDGTPLDASLEAETPTVVLGETETVAARSGVPLNDSNAAAWQQSQVTHVATLDPQKKGSNTAMAVAVTAVLMLVVFGAIGIGAWLFLRNGKGEFAKNTGNPSNASNQNPGANTSPFPTPQSSPSATPAKTPGNNASIPSTPPPAVDDQQTRSEVSDRINNWKSLTEARNINALTGLYAGSLEYYYTKRNVSANGVIADKQRAFREYNSISINISNMSVSTEPAGDSATATFDKQWSFEGAKTWVGRIRSQLKFRRVNGTWLITGERDIPGTYKRIR